MFSKNMGTQINVHYFYIKVHCDYKKCEIQQFLVCFRQIFSQMTPEHDK